MNDPKGRIVLSTKTQPYVEVNYSSITHIINVYLEIFGECDVLTEDLQPIVPLTMHRVNWEFLPPGEYPWEKLKEKIMPIIERAKKGNRGVFTKRLEIIHEAKPERIIYGRGGFNGYIAFGFPRKNLFVLESSYYGNATYVINQDWEDISKLTKAEILYQNLQIARLVHQNGWEKAVKEILD